MKRHKIVLDPVSNRRLICLLALTAGICFAVFCGNLSFGRASVHRHDRPTSVVFIFNVQHQPFRPAGGAARPWRVNHGSSQLQRNLRRLRGVDPGWIPIFDIFDSIICHFSPDMAAWLFELSVGFLAESFSISFGIISQQHGALIKNNWTQLQHARSWSSRPACAVFEVSGLETVSNHGRCLGYYQHRCQPIYDHVWGDAKDPSLRMIHTIMQIKRLGASVPNPAAVGSSAPLFGSRLNPPRHRLPPLATRVLRPPERGSPVGPVRFAADVWRPPWAPARSH